MNFDLVAPAYRWLEWMAFGHTLQRHRLAFLPAMAGEQRALVLGDGDGRFLAELLKANRETRAVSIDASARMLELASNRLTRAERQRVSFLRGDALEHVFPDHSYDLICTHFFLDCFSAPEVARLASKIACASKPGACWIVSEFREAGHGWRQLYTKAWVRTMYLFFRLVAGLKTTKIPNHGDCLRAAGFRLKSETTSRFGLVASELWLYEK